MENLDSGRFQTKAPTHEPLGKPIQSVSDRPLKNLIDTIRNRRNTLHFLPDAIAPELLETILKMALEAPSGYNLQPWRFILCQEIETKERLKRAAFNQQKIIEAPVVVIALGLKEGWKEWLHTIFAEGAKRGLSRFDQIEAAERGALNFLSKQEMSVWVTRQTMIAVSFMMLTAESFGLSTAPMEGFDAKAVKKEFDLPDEVEVVCLLAMGYGARPKKLHPGRLSIGQLVYSEKYKEPFTSSN